VGFQKVLITVNNPPCCDRAKRDLVLHNKGMSWRDRGNNYKKKGKLTGSARQQKKNRANRGQGGRFAGCPIWGGEHEQGATETLGEVGLHFSKNKKKKDREITGTIESGGKRGEGGVKKRIWRYTWSKQTFGLQGPTGVQRGLCKESFGRRMTVVH